MRTRKRHQLALGVALSISTHHAIADMSAAQAVTDFYDAIQKQECEKAIKLRLDYSLADCAKIDVVYLHHAVDKKTYGDNTVVYLEIDTEAASINRYFSGYTRLQKINQRWLIIGPYKNAKDYSLDEYIAEFLPTNKNKQPSQSTKKESQELPSGDIVAVNKLATPDSQTSQSKKQQQEIKPLSKKAQNTEESIAYANGQIPIEGNFVALLKSLREIFTAEDPGIILVDQSQSLLYFYENNNQLSGLYPILSSNLSNIPAGLYIIPFEAPSGTGTTNSNSFMLEKIVISGNKEFLLGDIHFIRNYFDNDKKNSFALSPIDIGKLQKLITSDTIVYIAQ
ncbi:MAG: Unknown protein [uncultured Thiotrichaceae bacterium]|uniref:Uncharacterized protein n=1 Tax=uncultured Thiotrichaceae bacterium TaxID=298394 RepID=A0A6S6UHB8_9GAMM|nr:MAG: Unknown protein [uncultured Thiotrichaceae bacterium]